MSRDQQRLDDYLGHILEAIERIRHYTADMDESAFYGNLLIQDGVIRNLEVVGEASHNIEKHFPEFAAGRPELPFVFAYEMRNALAHGYFKIDAKIVWRTIRNDLPAFGEQIRALLQERNSAGDADLSES